VLIPKVKAFSSAGAVGSTVGIGFLVDRTSFLAKHIEDTLCRRGTPVSTLTDIHSYRRLLGGHLTPEPHIESGCNNARAFTFTGVQGTYIAQ
jgi:hypothetical protein